MREKGKQLSVFFVLSNHLGLVQFARVIFNDTYRKYLEYQAVNHPALLHKEDSKVFQMVGIQEAVGDFRSIGQEKGFMMRGIWYTYGFGFSHEIRKIKTGGFIIAKYHSQRNGGSNSLFEAMRDAEKVVDEIIARMIKDSQDGHPLFNHSINDPSKFNIQPKFNSGEVGYSGFIVTFQFSSFWNECAMDEWATSEDEAWVTSDGEAWSFDTATQWMDDGLTPHNL